MTIFELTANSEILYRLAVFHGESIAQNGRLPPHILPLLCGGAERPFPFLLAGYLWDRVNFAYTAADGTEIWGFIMTRVSEGQEVVAWAEAPATTYNELEQTVFLTVIADLRVGD